jgi:hypothetical protein
MVFLVDTVEVAPGDVDAYLEAVAALGVPVMTGAGAVFVSVRRSDPAAGAPATVEVTWSFDDYGAWNEIRRRLVLDPRWYEYGRAVAALRGGGTRRFLHPAAPTVPAAPPGAGGAAAF